MIETLPTILIITILELLDIVSLGKILISSKKINNIFNNSLSDILIVNKKAIYKIRKCYNNKLYWNYVKHYLSNTGYQRLYDISFYKDEYEWNRRHIGIKNDGRDFVYFFNYLHKKPSKWNWSMLEAARSGNQLIVDFYISKGANNWNYGMYQAAKGGNQSLVEFFISKGAHNMNWGMYGAARGGNQSLVEFFISKRAHDWDWAMEGAMRGGNQLLVNFFISKGAKKI